MIDRAQLDREIARLSQTLALYQRASGKALDQVLGKKSKDLRIELFKAFRKLAPERGQVRSERIEALKRGEGIHVRQKVYEAIGEQFGLDATGAMHWRTRGGKERTGGQRGGLNFQALAVRRELNLRESGRGFTAHSASKPLMPEAEATEGESVSKYGGFLAQFNLTGKVEGQGKAEAAFKWGVGGEQSEGVVNAIYRTRGMAAALEAVRAVTEDMVPYIEEHIGKAATAAGLGKI